MSEAFWASYALLWALVCAQALVLLGVMREIGRILLGSRGGVARDGVRVGARLPDFSFRVGGDERLLRETLDQPLSILLFTLANCPVCPQVIEMVERWAGRLDGVGAVTLVAGGDARDGVGSDSSTAGAVDAAVGRLLRVRASPFAFAVTSEGVVLAKGLLNRHRDIKRLLKRARERGWQNTTPGPAAVRAVGTATTST